MRKFIGLMLLLGLFSLAAVAQENYSKAEVFGGFHSSASVSGISASDSGFAFMLGGGADVKVAPAISVRLLQFDWLSLHANGNSDNNNMRLSTGVVFHF